MDFHNRSLPLVRCAARPGIPGSCRLVSSELLMQIFCKTMLLARNPRAASRLGCCPARHYGFALPVRVDVCVPAKSVTETVAFLTPVVCPVCGLNCTVTVHEPPGANVIWPTGLTRGTAGPQVDNTWTMENSVALAPPSTPCPMAVRVVLPLLVSMKIWTGSKAHATICAGVVPGQLRGTVPKLRVVGVRAGTPAITVNVTVLLVPPGVVTLTVLGVSAAVPAIVNVAVTEVGLTTRMLLTVTNVPDTVIAVVPVRLVPARVTGTAVPRAPVAGRIEASVGAATAAAWNSTAPASTARFAFLERSKKSFVSARGPQLMLTQLLASSTVAPAVRLKIGLGTLDSLVPGGTL